MLIYNNVFSYNFSISFDKLRKLFNSEKDLNSDLKKYIEKDIESDKRLREKLL